MRILAYKIDIYIRRIVYCRHIPVEKIQLLKHIKKKVKEQSL